MSDFNVNLSKEEPDKAPQRRLKVTWDHPCVIMHSCNASFPTKEAMVYHAKKWHPREYAELMRKKS